MNAIRLILCLLMLLNASPLQAGGLLGKITNNTPFDPSTYRFPEPHKPAPSGLSLYSAPYIDDQGTVYSEQTNTAHPARIIGRADLTYEGNLAYWRWDRPPNPKPRRAPKHDRLVIDDGGAAPLANSRPAPPSPSRPSSQADNSDQWFILGQAIREAITEN